MTTEIEITRHFVTFLSRGSFVPEATSMSIPTWDTDIAQDMAAGIVERYNTQPPFCFYFTTRGRGKNDLDSRIIRESSRYFINCQVRTLEEVRADPDSQILAANMASNEWDKVAATRKGLRWADPVLPDDVVLEN